jgi:hypothetical protein
MKNPSNIVQFPGKRKQTRAPSGLKAAGRRLWQQIQLEYDISDPGGLSHLLSAARAEDDIKRLREKVETEGDLICNHVGTQVANPLLQAIRGSEAVKRQALSALNLDIEPLRAKPGRPPGR